MENTIKNHEQINGWGVDADPKNDPTYPMKNRTDDEQTGYSWERPTQQPVDIEVLQSIERPNVSAVFGTSVPPSGLSGKIRRYAFRYSENHYGHWLPLLLADRINVVEGIIDDFKQGRIPNIFAEKGLKADWKYNRSGLITRVLVVTAITVGVVALMRRKKGKELS